MEKDPVLWVRNGRPLIPESTTSDSDTKSERVKKDMKVGSPTMSSSFCSDPGGTHSDRSKAFLTCDTTEKS